MTKSILLTAIFASLNVFASNLTVSSQKQDIEPHVFIASCTSTLQAGSEITVFMDLKDTKLGTVLLQTKEAELPFMDKVILPNVALNFDYYSQQKAFSVILSENATLTIHAKDVKEDGSGAHAYLVDPTDPELEIQLFECKVNYLFLDILVLNFKN